MLTNTYTYVITHSEQLSYVLGCVWIVAYALTGRRKQS